MILRYLPGDAPKFACAVFLQDKLSASFHVCDTAFQDPSPSAADRFQCFFRCVGKSFQSIAGREQLRETAYGLFKEGNAYAVGIGSVFSDLSHISKVPCVFLILQLGP